MNIPRKCSKVVATFSDGAQTSFYPIQEIEEFEDCYEFYTKLVGDKITMVVIQKMELRYIFFEEGE